MASGAASANRPRNVIARIVFFMGLPRSNSGARPALRRKAQGTLEVAAGAAALIAEVSEGASGAPRPPFETIATTLGNRGAHAGPRDAVHRLTRTGRFDPQLGPHEKTAAYSGFALYVTGWSFGSLAYLLARHLRVTKADAWHAFFWPLVKDVTP